MPLLVQSCLLIVVGSFNTVVENKKTPKHHATAQESAFAPPKMTRSFVPAPVAVPSAPITPSPISVAMAQNNPSALSESSSSPMNQGVLATVTPSKQRPVQHALEVSSRQ